MDNPFLKNNELKISKETHPWPHWQIDGFFNQKDFAPLQKKLCSTSSGFLKREDDEADISYMFLPDLKLAKFFLSDSFKSFLEQITEKPLQVHVNSLVQLRKMDENSPAFPVHIDSQEERSLVCLFYVSPDWAPDRGGELCLFENEEAEGPAKTIAPVENRMVLFFSEETHWHSVNKVRDWTRYSVVSDWIVQEGVL